MIACETLVSKAWSTTFEIVSFKSLFYFEDILNFFNMPKKTLRFQFSLYKKN